MRCGFRNNGRIEVKLEVTGDIDTTGDLEDIGARIRSRDYESGAVIDR